MRSAHRPSLVVAGLAGAILGAILGAAPAPGADSGPVIVVPGRPGVPIIINGVDVTGAVIEGDFGLYLPHMVNPVVIPAPIWAPPPFVAPPFAVQPPLVAPPFYGGGFDPRRYDDGYFPAIGRAPGYGRREIEPPADRRLPPPAQSFRRSWSSQSEPVPASVGSPPPLLVAPQIYPGGGRKR